MFFFCLYKADSGRQMIEFREGDPKVLARELGNEEMSEVTFFELDLPTYAKEIGQAHEGGASALYMCDEQSSGGLGWCDLLCKVMTLGLVIENCTKPKLEVTP